MGVGQTYAQTFVLQILYNSGGFLEIYNLAKKGPLRVELSQIGGKLVTILG